MGVKNQSHLLCRTWESLYTIIYVAEKAHDYEVLSKTQASEQFKRLKKYTEDVNDDDEPCGRPKCSVTDDNAYRMNKLVLCDRTTHVKLSKEHLCISKYIIQ